MAAAARNKRAIFDDDDDDDDDDSSSSHSEGEDELAKEEPEEEEEPLLKLNESYAKRFEHNAEREELQRLEAKYPDMASGASRKRRVEKERKRDDDDAASDSSSSEEEDDGVVNPKQQVKFLEALVKLRKRDPTIYEQDATLFEDDDDNDDDDENGRKEKKKSLRLREMLARDAQKTAEVGVSSDSDSENENDEATRRTYHDEQEALRASFKSAAADDDANTQLLELKKSKQKDAAPSSSYPSQLMDTYYGKSAEKLDADERFLRDYILNRGWMEKDDDDDDDDDGSDSSDVSHSSDVSSDFDDHEAFERQYNFRYEEGPEAHTITSHPRHVEGSLRAEDTRRKDARARKKDSKENQERERLALLQKRDLKRRVNQVKVVAGGIEDKDKVAKASLKAMLVDDGAFNPKAHDDMMARLFDDDYYGAEDEDEDGMGALEALDDDDDEEEEEYDEEEEEEAKNDDVGPSPSAEEPPTEPSRRQRKKNASRRKQKNRQQPHNDDPLLRSVLAVDDPSQANMSSSFVRFPYKDVIAQDYACTAVDVLTMSDKELNQVVSLKKLVPYADDDMKVVKRAKKIKKHLDKLASYRDENDDIDNDDDDDDGEHVVRKKRTSKKERRRKARGDSIPEVEKKKKSEPSSSKEPKKPSSSKESKKKESRSLKKEEQKKRKAEDAARKDRLSAFEVPTLKKRRQEPLLKLF